MSLVREQILAAALATLNTAPPSGVVVTMRDRASAADPADVPTSSLYFVSETVRRPNPSHPLVARSMTLGLEATAKGNVSTRPSTAVQKQISWYTARLVGSNLGGLANDIRELRHEAKVVQGEHAFIQVISLFEIDYQTRAADADLRA